MHSKHQHQQATHSAIIQFLLRHTPIPTAPKPQLEPHRAHLLTSRFTTTFRPQNNLETSPFVAVPELQHYRRRNRHEDEGESLYSHAEVVDVRDLLHVPSASERLARAVTETLDMKPSRATLALSYYSLLLSHLQQPALQVAKWALETALHRSETAAVKELALSYEIPAKFLPHPQPPKPLPEPLVRFVCAELNHSASASLLLSASNVAAESICKHLNPANVIRLHVPAAITLVGVISTLAALQCVVTKRNRKSRPSFTARYSSAVVNIDVIGDGPTVVIMNRKRTLITKHAKEMADELIEDIICALKDFESYALHG